MLRTWFHARCGALVAVLVVLSLLALALAVPTRSATADDPAPAEPAAAACSSTTASSSAACCSCDADCECDCEAETAISAPHRPQYDENGRLLLPEDYRTWVFVGSGLGLNYSEAPREGPGNFTHVYTQPEAYEEFVRSGHFPEQTMFVTAVFTPQSAESINRQGYFPGGQNGLEAAVKDSARFAEGWGYFLFERGPDPRLGRLMPKVLCYDCHRQHAAVDHVFVQFYPVLREHLERRTGAASAGDE